MVSGPFHLKRQHTSTIRAGGRSSSSCSPFLTRIPSERGLRYVFERSGFTAVDPRPEAGFICASGSALHEHEPP